MSSVINEAEVQNKTMYVATTNKRRSKKLSRTLCKSIFTSGAPLQNCSELE